MIRGLGSGGLDLARMDWRASISSGVGRGDGSSTCRVESTEGIEEEIVGEEEEVGKRLVGRRGRGVRDLERERERDFLRGEVEEGGDGEGSLRRGLP